MNILCLDRSLLDIAIMLKVRNFARLTALRFLVFCNVLCNIIPYSQKFSRDKYFAVLPNSA